MKNILFLAILIANTVLAQDYVPIPTENVSWRYQYSLWMGPSDWSQSNYIDSIERDTVINGNTYYWCNRSLLFRNEGKQVLQWSEEYSMDMVLYDFGLEVGDTFRTIVLESIDSVELLVGKRRRLNFENLDVAGSFSWIEGIGASVGFDDPLHNGWYLVDRKFLCFHQNDTLIYKHATLDCDYEEESPFTNIDEIVSLRNEFQFYPNPTSGKIYFTSIQENIYLLSLAGQILSSWTNVKQIDLSQFPSGIYLLRSSNNLSSNYCRVIVEN